MDLNRLTGLSGDRHGDGDKDREEKGREEKGREEVREEDLAEEVAESRKRKWWPGNAEEAARDCPAKMGWR